jgi:lysyl-tRNA synthetase class 2
MNWRPTASLEILRRRAQLLADIRRFFSERDVLEVTTPTLSSAGTTEPNIHNVALSLRAFPAAAAYYLHASPELYMKRLLAAGSGPIYQICTVFRDNDIGRFHRPEFSMLEWYRPGWTYRQLLDEVLALIHAAAGAAAPAHTLLFSYRELFQHYAKLDPVQASAESCRQCCLQHNIDIPVGMDEQMDPWLDWILSALIVPALPAATLIGIYDFPPSQAALARIRPDTPAVAERFEVYWGGLELANGFQELIDAHEQAARFERENRLRAERGLPQVTVDQNFLAALHAGLPASAGVALGVDRLLMALTGAGHIHEVVAFADDTR